MVLSGLRPREVVARLGGLRLTGSFLSVVSFGGAGVTHGQQWRQEGSDQVARSRADDDQLAPMMIRKSLGDDD